MSCCNNVTCNQLHQKDVLVIYVVANTSTVSTVHIANKALHAVVGKLLSYSYVKKSILLDKSGLFSMQGKTA